MTNFQKIISNIVKMSLIAVVAFVGYLMMTPNSSKAAMVNNTESHISKVDNIKAQGGVNWNVVTGGQEPAMSRNVVSGGSEPEVRISKSVKVRGVAKVKVIGKRISR
jgi:hypothetical protein